MKSQQIGKAFAAFLAKKLGSTPKQIEALMNGINTNEFTSEVASFVTHAAKTITGFNSGYLKQQHINEIFSDVVYLGIDK